LVVVVVAAVVVYDIIHRHSVSYDNTICHGASIG
jgi:hypothetical protein